MQIDKIILWIEQHADERIKAIYQKNNPMIVQGVKLTELRALAKQIGHDSTLALKLYALNIYETMMLATMIANPDEIQYEQIMTWAKQAHQTNIIDQGLNQLMLAHPKDYLLFLSWCESDDHDLRYAGFSFLSAYYRHVNLNEMDDNVNQQLLHRIEQTISHEPLSIQNAMNNAVVMAGLHVPLLVELAKEVADKIGYILPLKAKNACNIQSASDYINRYINQPKFSRVAKLKLQMKDVTYDGIL